MEKDKMITLIGGSSIREAEEARDLLEGAGANYKELQTTDDGPVTIVVDGICFPYKGLDEIRGYCAAMTPK